MIINLPAMQETQVQSLSREDLLEKGMATHSSILAWRIPGTRSLASNSPCTHKELDVTEWPTLFTFMVILRLPSCTQKGKESASVSAAQSCPTLCDPTVCAWNSPGENTGVGCHSFLQGIFPTQQWNPGLLHCPQILYRLSYQGSPNITIWVALGVAQSQTQLKRLSSSSSSGKESTCQCRRHKAHSLDPWVQYSFLENLMDREAWGYSP